MSDSSDDEYTLEQAQEEIDILRRVRDETVTAVRNAANEDVLEFLIKDEGLDITHDGERGLGQVRQAVLESPVASTEQKRLVSLRGDDTSKDIRIPDNVYRNAKVALDAGKPVVLYGPTGTGKQRSQNNSHRTRALDIPSTQQHPRGPPRTSSAVLARITVANH